MAFATNDANKLRGRNGNMANDMSQALHEIDSKFQSRRTIIAMGVKGLLHHERDAVVFSHDPQMSCLSLASAARAVVYSSMRGVTPELTEKLMRNIFCDVDRSHPCPSQGVLGLLQESCATIEPTSQADRQKYSDALAMTESFIERESLPKHTSIANRAARNQSVFVQFYRHAFRVRLCIEKLEACATILQTIIDDPYTHGISSLMLKQPAIKAKVSIVDPAIEHLKTALSSAASSALVSKCERLAADASEVSADAHLVVRNLMIIQLGVRMILPAIRLHVALTGFVGAINLNHDGFNVDAPQWSSSVSCDVPDYTTDEQSGTRMADMSFRVDRQLFIASKSADVWRYFTTHARNLHQLIKQQIHLCDGAGEGSSQRKIMVVPKALMQEYIKRVDVEKLKRYNALLQTSRDTK